MTYNPWDIVVVPFPFVDSPQAKPRPVVLLSVEQFMISNGHSIAAMITSSLHEPWQGDTPIYDLKTAGLSRPSIIRLKIFTLDMRLKPRIIGKLHDQDIAQFQKNARDNICNTH